MTVKPDRRPLTPRMVQVLQALADGQQRMAIALAHRISTQTLKDELKLIHYRLGVHTAAAAVAEGFRRNLIK